MSARIRAARENESGFTLIELLIVIVILGVLSGIVVFSVSGITNRGKTEACNATIRTVQLAEEANYAQKGSYAATTTILKTNGFLASAPPTTEVTITITLGPPASVVVAKAPGVATGSCAP